MVALVEKSQALIVTPAQAAALVQRTNDSLTDKNKEGVSYTYVPAANGNRIVKMFKDGVLLGYLGPDSPK